MVYLYTTKNKWKQVKVSKTRIFSNLKNLIIFLIELNAEKVNFKIFFNTGDFDIYKLEVDNSHKSPKKIKYDEILQVLENHPNLYAKVLLSE